MFGYKTYVYNKDTGSYEVDALSRKGKIIAAAAVIVFSLLSYAGYSALFTGVLKMKNPKTAFLLNRNSQLLSKVGFLNQRMDKENEALKKLEMRDNIVYRPIFGMEELSQDVRDAGFGGVDRYSYLDQLYNADYMKSSAMRMDVLTKKAYIQSHSFDDIQALSKKAGDMASCIPSIYPVSTSSRNHFSSTFGYRSDPMNHYFKMHDGVDIGGPSNEPVFATGDGKVVEVGFNFFGYGNFVVIDHGFGYRTLYGHLRAAFVSQGQMLHRGDEVGQMGNTGRSTGTHLHYEVQYKGHPINPVNFYDNTISPEEYAKLVKPLK